MTASGKIRVLDPTVRPAAEGALVVARLETLRGKILGIRVDRAWRSFGHFANRIAVQARDRLGVAKIVTFDPGIRIGTTEEERRKVAGFVRDVDAAIVGLGT